MEVKFIFKGQGQIWLYALRGIGLHLKSFLWKKKHLFFFLAYYVVRETESRNNFIFSIFVRKKKCCVICVDVALVLFFLIIYIYWTRNELMSYTLYIFMNKFFSIFNLLNILLFKGWICIPQAQYCHLIIKEAGGWSKN